MSRERADGIQGQLAPPPILFIVKVKSFLSVASY